MAKYKGLPPELSFTPHKKAADIPCFHIVYPQPVFSFLSNHTSDSHDGTVGCIVTDLDAVLFVTGMYDCATTHIDGYVAGITDDITRLSFGIGYPYTTASHRTGRMWQADTKVAA